MLAEYSGVVVVLAALVAAWMGLTLMHHRLAPRRPASRAEGREPPARPALPARLLVPFHRLALAAVLVAAVAVLLFPWAAVQRELGWLGLSALSGLVLPIAVGVLHGFRTRSFE